MEVEPRCEFCPGTETLHIATCPLLQLLADLLPDDSEDPEVIALREIFPDVPIIRVPHNPAADGDGSNPPDEFPEYLET